MDRVQEILKEEFGLNLSEDEIDYISSPGIELSWLILSEAENALEEQDAEIELAEAIACEYIENTYGVSILDALV